MFLLVLYLFVFAPLISSKPAGISTAEDQIATPAKLKQEYSQLSKRTFPKGSTNSSGRPSLSSSLSLYLRELYRKGVKNLKGKLITGYDQQDTSNLLTSINTCNVVILKFNITKPASKVKDVISAEFRIYRRSTALQSGNSATGSVTTQTILDQIQPTGPHTHRQVQATVGQANIQGGWESFDITPTFVIWYKNGSTNHGLLLSTTKSGKKVHPYQLGYVGFDGPADKRPFIIVQFKKAKSQNDEEKVDEEGTSNPQASLEKEDDKDDEEGTDDPQAPAEEDDDTKGEEGTSNSQAPEKDNDEGEEAPFTD